MGLLDYIKANTPRSTRPVANPLTVINQGLLNPNQYNAPAANRFKDSMFGLFGIVPGVGDAASAAESADLFNRGENVAGSMAALGALPLVPSLGGLFAHTVYHGSPHKFTKFDMSKIGTGEGAQAYGHGLYFAESPAVARSYLEANGAPTYMVNGVDVGNTTPTAYAAKLLSTSGTPPRQAVNNSRNLLSKAGKLDAERDQYFKDTLAEIDRLEQLSPTIEKGGAFYKVDIPDESIPRMLDWDAPLSKQPEGVRVAVQDLGLPANATGKDAYNALANLARDGAIARGNNAATTLGGSQSAASVDLQGYGIPGIRYLDGMSRGKGGTSNFVLFDDQLPRILEINGQPTGLLSYADEAAQAAKNGGGLLNVNQTQNVKDFADQVKQKYGLKAFDVYEGNSGNLKLQMFEVPKEMRKQGIGTKAMQELVDYADSTGKKLTLSPGLPDDRHGTTSRARLVKFYKKFGFVENKGRNKDFTISEGMIREPKNAAK